MGIYFTHKRATKKSLIYKYKLLFFKLFFYGILFSNTFLNFFLYNAHTYTNKKNIKYLSLYANTFFFAPKKKNLGI